jgi:CIC family chloride channel protein
VIAEPVALHPRVGIGADATTPADPSSPPTIGATPTGWQPALLAWLQRRHPSETQVLVASGLIVGIGSGVGAVVFRALIAAFTTLFFGILRPALATVLGPAAVVAIPALGGLLFGPLISLFAPEAKGHGVPEVMMAVALRGGRIRPIVAVVEALASAL